LNSWSLKKVCLLLLLPIEKWQYSNSWIWVFIRDFVTFSNEILGFHFNRYGFLPFRKLLWLLVVIKDMSEYVSSSIYLWYNLFTLFVNRFQIWLEISASLNIFKLLILHILLLLSCRFNGLKFSLLKIFDEISFYFNCKWFLVFLLYLS